MKLHHASFRAPVVLCFPDGAGTTRTTITPEEGRRLDAMVDWNRRVVILKGRVGASSVYRVLPFELFTHFDVLQEDWPAIESVRNEPVVPVGAGGKPKFIKPE